LADPLSFHRIFLVALFLSEVLIMDDTSSMNALALALLIAMGINENSLTQSIAFGLLNDRTEGSFRDFGCFVNVRRS
jgi:hypothetical protein